MNIFRLWEETQETQENQKQDYWTPTDQTKTIKPVSSVNPQVIYRKKPVQSGKCQNKTNLQIKKLEGCWFHSSP